MQQAFWGLALFIGGVILAAGVYFLVKTGIMYQKETKPYKKVKEAKVVVPKTDSVGSAIFTIAIFFPLISGVIITLLLGDFSADHPLATFIIAVSPAIIILATYFVTIKKRIK